MRKNMDDLSLEEIEKLNKAGTEFVVEDGHIYKKNEKEEA